LKGHRYLNNPEGLRSVAFAGSLSSCTWNGLRCGGSYLDAGEYRQIRRILGALNLRSVLETGAGETSILFRRMGLRTFLLEYQSKEAELEDQIAKQQLSNVDLLFIDSPQGALAQLVRHVKPRFVMYHDALRDAVNLFKDQVKHELKLMYFLDSPRGLALFAGPPFRGLPLPPEPFDAQTMVPPHQSRIAVLDTSPTTAAPGCLFDIRVLLTNTTEKTLSSRYNRPVLVAYHWLTSDRQILTWDGLRTPLPVDLDPGDSIEFAINVLAPEVVGQFVLQVAVVQESVAWFETERLGSEAELLVRVVELHGHEKTAREPVLSGSRQKRVELIREPTRLMRNPDLREMSRAENLYSINMRPKYMQLSRLAAQVLREFDDQPTPVRDLFPRITPEVREAIDVLVELGALLPAEARVLITGCGRSGTKYIASVLSAAGLDVGHETMGRDGIASWLLAADSGYVPYGPVRRFLHFQTILHQTRAPLLVISSMQTSQKSSWEYICRNIPCSPDEPLLLRCAKYWRHWNLHAESVAMWRYRIEDIESVWGELCERVGIPPDLSPLVKTPRRINTREGAYHQIGWGDIMSLDKSICFSIQEQAARYGYDV